MDKVIYAFGEPVPQDIIDLIREENGEECLTTEFIETLTGTNISTTIRTESDSRSGFFYV